MRYSLFIYGGNTLAATYNGRRERGNADKAFTFSVVFGIIASALVVLAGILLAAPTAALLSQNGALYGERDTKGVKYVLKTALIASEIMCFVMLALFELLPLPIGGLFGKLTTETAAELETAMRLFAICVPFYGISYLLRVFYQCTKQRLVASVFTVIEGAAVIVPMIWVSAMIDDKLIWLPFGMSEFVSVALIVLVMQILSKRRGHDNYLMLDNSEEKNTLDMTISNNIQSAVELSESI